MKTLYLDPEMGVAGDMFAAALYELIDDKEDFIREINAAKIPAVSIEAQKAVRCGISGTHMKVTVNGKEEQSCTQAHIQSHEHAHFGHFHRSMADIEAIIDSLNVTDKVKEDTKAIYKIIAEAESRAHARKVTEIHFHEVGMADAIADITMACMLMERLSPDRVIVSPVCTGFGHVHASHGIIPVPAPATAYILEGVPSYEGDTEAELCTPTGAALIKYFADEFGRMPVLTDKKTGYGMGSREFEKLNALRAVFGFSEDEKDKVIELSLTIDDMTGEEIAFACERIFEAGALDVYAQPVYMKKNRPGILIDVLAKEEDKDKIVEAVFKHTTTLGIRQALCERYILKRKQEIVETPYGPVRKKVSHGYGCTKEKPEYEDLADISKKTGLSFFEIEENI